MQFPNLKFPYLAAGLFGALVGDACGVPYEFKSANELPPYAQIDMTPPVDFERTYGVPIGTWSDDGALALCLMESLIECEGWNAHDFGQRLVAWYDEGVWAVDRHVFDVGVTTAGAIRRIRNGGNAETAGDAGDNANGNGSLMRALPVALWALQNDVDDAEIIRIARAQSCVTHAHVRSQLCCALYCLWAASTCRGENFEDGWMQAAQTLRTHLNDQEIGELEFHIRPSDEPHGTGSGYVVDCLRSARLALRQNSYQDAIKTAIAFGNDTDTTACVAGGIAGLQWGITVIPEHWLHALRERENVADLLLRL